MNNDEIYRFLTICKIATKSEFILDETDEDNSSTITYLGYTLDDVEEEIMSLRVEDYYQGPLKDYNGYARDFWVFKKIIQNKVVYIKVKVKDINFDGEKKLNTFCISFHFDKKPSDKKQINRKM